MRLFLILNLFLICSGIVASASEDIALKKAGEAFYYQFKLNENFDFLMKTVYNKLPQQLVTYLVPTQEIIKITVTRKVEFKYEF